MTGTQEGVAGSERCPESLTHNKSKEETATEVNRQFGVEYGGWQKPSKTNDPCTPQESQISRLVPLGEVGPLRKGFL